MPNVARRSCFGGTGGSVDRRVGIFFMPGPAGSDRPAAMAPMPATPTGVPSATPDRAGGSARSPAGAGFSLILKIDSPLSTAAGAAVGAGAAGMFASHGLPTGPMSILILSGAPPSGPGTFEPMGGRTDGSPGTEIVSAGRSGSEGLIEMRGLSLMGAGAVLAESAGCGSLGTAGGAEVTGAAGAAGAPTTGAAGAGVSVGVDGPSPAGLSVRSLNFNRDPGGSEDSSLMQIKV
jgi:hypothetical protein